MFSVRKSLNLAKYQNTTWFNNSKNRPKKKTQPNSIKITYNKLQVIFPQIWLAFQFNCHHPFPVTVDWLRPLIGPLFVSRTFTPQSWCRLPGKYHNNSVTLGRTSPVLDSVTVFTPSYVTKPCGHFLLNTRKW